MTGRHRKNTSPLYKSALGQDVVDQVSVNTSVTIGEGMDEYEAEGDHGGRPPLGRGRPADFCRASASIRSLKQGGQVLPACRNMIRQRRPGGPVVFSDEAAFGTKAIFTKRVSAITML